MLMLKDRAEHATVVFDFTAIAALAGLAPPTEGTDYFDGVGGDYYSEDYMAGSEGELPAIVQVARDFGDDQLLTEGGVVIDGLKVKQLFRAGTPGGIYDVAAVATFSSGDQLRIAHTIRVT